MMTKDYFRMNPDQDPKKKEGTSPDLNCKNARVICQQIETWKKTIMTATNARELLLPKLMKGEVNLS